MNQITLRSGLLKVREYLNHKYFFSVVVPVLLFTLFHLPIERLVAETIVKYLLRYINSSVFNDWIVTGFAVYLLALSFSRAFNYVASLKPLLIMILSSVIYIYYRNFSDEWTFTAFNFFPNLKYADVLLWATLLNGWLYVCHFSRSKDNRQVKGGFKDDSPLGRDKEDEVGFEPYVKTISKRLLDTNIERAIAIGINGKWGSGKTSFIDLMKRELVKEDVILVSFDPWNFHSPSAIIKDFFDTVQDAIRPFHSTLSKKLLTYSDKLIEVNDTDFGKYLNFAFSSFKESSSSDSLYEDINEAIKAINKKLIIFIDDVDRLDKDEIVEVIRLIRNTANFSNTVFVVAYDRNYVLNALREHNSFNHAQFLEKIFQIEVTLPYYDKKIVHRKLANEIKALFEEKHHEQIEDEIIGNRVSKADYLDEWIESIRDVTRVVNSLSVNLSELIGEVEFSEFLRLELIRLKFPAIYELLFKKTLEFFSLTNDGRGLQRYKLTSIGDSSGGEFGLHKDDSSLHLYMHKNAVNLSISKLEIKKVHDLIAGIFEVHWIMPSFKKDLSVVYPSKFNLYFAYTLLDGTLSEILFSRARVAGLDAFKKQIDHWVDAKLDFEIQRRFLQIRIFDSRKDFENVIAAIFYYGRKQIGGRQMGYDVKDIVDKLSDYNGKTSALYYNGDKQAYRDFVKGVFDEAISPFVFEASIIRHVGESFGDESFPFTKAEILLMGQNYFKRYADQTNRIDDYVWDLYNCCQYNNWVSTGYNSHRPELIIPDETKKILIAIADKDFDNFLQILVYSEPFNPEHKSVDKLATTLFGSWDDFKTYLDSKNVKDYKYLTEFKNLLAAFEATGFAKYVKFDFDFKKIL